MSRVSHSEWEPVYGSPQDKLVATDVRGVLFRHVQEYTLRTDVPIVGYRRKHMDQWVEGGKKMGRWDWEYEGEKCADTKQGRQVMADRDRLWQQYDVAKHRVYAPDQVAAARKAIEDEIRERVEKPWTRLQDELRAHKAWYRNPPTAPDISAHVGMDSERRFWGGVWIDGDPLTRDEWGDDPLVEDGDSPQQVIDGLIASIRQYRVDRERERAEMEAEEADTEQGDK
jgi:hypothetical protein